MAKGEIEATALFVAAVRARENERRDRLFQDDLSSLLAGTEGLSWLAASEANPGSNYHRDSFPYLEVRTRYFDDWASQAVRDSRANQLVVLGAGMDTRAFRLRFPPKLSFWEVDTHELFAIKEARLQSAGVRLDLERVVVEADLTSRGWTERLLRTGFKKDSPVVWIAEGLFQYLTASDVNQILEETSSVSSEGSRFGAEVISEEFLQRRSNAAKLRKRKDRGTPWVFGTDDPEKLLGSHGWVVDQKLSALEAAIAYRRWLASPIGGSTRFRGDPPGSYFVSATKVSSGKSRAK